MSSSQIPSPGSHPSCRSSVMSPWDRAGNPPHLKRHLQALETRGHSPGPRAPGILCSAPEFLSLPKALASGSCSQLHPNATFNPEGLSLTQPQAGEVRSPRWLKEPMPQRADPIPTRKGWRSWASDSELGEGRKKDERARQEASSQDRLIPAHPSLFRKPYPCT